MSINSKQGYEIESQSRVILENEGYEIILEPENTRRRSEKIPKSEREKYYKEFRTKIEKYSKLLGKYSIPLYRKISEIDYIEQNYLTIKDNEKFKNKIIEKLDSGEIAYQSWIPTGNSFKNTVEEVCDHIVRPTKKELEEEYNKKIKKTKPKFEKTVDISSRLKELEAEIRKINDAISKEKTKNVRNNLEAQKLSAKLIITLREQNYLKKFLTFDFSELSLAYFKNSKSTYSSVDYFCKKNRNYYVFDIKHKLDNKDKSTFDKITVTAFEVLNYNRLVSENNIKVKIMIVLKKRNGFNYKIFDWSEFKIPEKYKPDKTPKISIKLKDKTDLNCFESYNLSS